MGNVTSAMPSDPFLIYKLARPTVAGSDARKICSSAAPSFAARRGGRSSARRASDPNRGLVELHAVYVDQTRRAPRALDLLPREAPLWWSSTVVEFRGGAAAPPRNSTTVELHHSGAVYYAGESFPLYHSMNLFVYFDFDTLCSYP